MKWPKVKLDSIKADLRYAFIGGPFGSNLTTRDYVEEGVPVIRGNNLPADRTFLDDDFVFVTEEKADKLQSNTAYPGDIFLPNAVHSVRSASFRWKRSSPDMSSHKAR